MLASSVSLINTYGEWNTGLRGSKVNKKNGALYDRLKVINSYHGVTIRILLHVQLES